MYYFLLFRRYIPVRSSSCDIKKRQYPYEIFICPAPPLLAGSMHGGMADPLHSPRQGTLPFPVRPPACCSGYPHRVKVSLYPFLMAACHGLPRTGCRSCLPSFITILGFTLSGRHLMAKLVVRRNCIKKKPHKTAAYWYSIFVYVTFRRKACI